MLSTIKVPVELRERVSRYAREQHLTQAEILAQALDLLDRELFFSRLRRDIAQTPEDAADVAERESWLAGSLGDAGS